MRCLAKHTLKSAKDQYTTFCRLTSRNLRKEAKMILKLLFLIRRLNLRKNQRAQSNREKLQKCLKFDSGCNVWQCTSQNLLKMNLLKIIA